MEIDVTDKMKVATVIGSNHNHNPNDNNNSVTVPNTPIAKSGCCSIISMNLLVKNHPRTPQEFYFESRGKSCKKLLKFNGSSNKVNVFPIGILPKDMGLGVSVCV